MTLLSDPVAAAVRPRVLAFGAVHPAVFELQARLNTVHAQALGAGQPGLPSAPLQQDGHFGPRTREAVLGFQRRVFPDPSDWDGRVGPRTWAMLDRVAPGLSLIPPPLQTTDEVRRRALALIGAYVPSAAGDGRFDEIARDYGEPCLRRPAEGCGTTCGFLPHWLLWRLGCSDLEIVNRAEPGGYRYRPSQNISRLWSYGQPPFLSALAGALQQGQRPEPGDIVFLRRWPDGDSRSEHVTVFLEERREAGRTVWRSADAGQREGGQREGGLEAARYRERELTLDGQQGRLGERTIIGWLPLGRLHFDRQPPKPTPGPLTEPSSAETNDQTADLGDAFFPGLLAVAASLGTDPLFLLQTMMAESDLRADAHNPHGDASGLIQFMPDTLRGLGWTAGPGAFRRLSAEEQLPYVQRYYAPYRASGLNSTARLRQATFLPATLGAGSEPDTVLAARDGPYASAYRGNSGLDRRHDGTIRVSDLTDAVERRCRGPRWAEARARLEAARGTPRTEPPTPIPGPVPHGTPPSGTLRPVLRPGARGPWVTQAQRQLNRVDARQRGAGRPGLAGAPLEEDGLFGPRTGRAVRDFQSRAFPGQPQEHDGVIGPHTWRQLDGWTAGTPVPPPGPPTIVQPPLLQPPAAPGDSGAWEGFRSRLVQVALEEYARWHAGGQVLRETDPRMRPALKGYWMDGPGLSASQAEQRVDLGSPWSAAFISWIMRRAGAGQMFYYASAHTEYCAAAKRNRLRRDLGNPFWLYRPEERGGARPQGRRPHLQRAGEQRGDFRQRGRQTQPELPLRRGGRGSAEHAEGDRRQRQQHRRLQGPAYRRQRPPRAGRHAEHLLRRAGAAHRPRRGIRRISDPQGDDMTWPTAQPFTPGTPADRIPAGREAIRDVPGIGERHSGPGPALILHWNEMPPSSVVDVALHFHGFSEHGAAMNLERDKEPASGLDFTDPRHGGSLGRRRPTLGILPRGHFYGGRSGRGYDFPELVRPGGVQQLIRWSLDHFAEHTGPPGTGPSDTGRPALRVGRLILSAHSGGGAALWRVLAELDPHEVQVFDALYQSPERLLRWVRSRIVRDGPHAGQADHDRYMREEGGALRVLYTSGGGTAGNSLEARRHLHQALAPFPELRPWYRVERAQAAHGAVPGQYGWQLLADAAGDLTEPTPAQHHGHPRPATPT